MDQHWHSTMTDKWEKKRERESEKDSGRLTNVESGQSLSKRYPNRLSHPNSEEWSLYSGLSKNPFILSHSNQASSGLQKRLMLPGGVSEVLFPRFSHSSPPSALAQHPVQGSPVRGQKPRLSVWWEQVAEGRQGYGLGKVAAGKGSRKGPWTYRSSKWGKPRQEQKMGKIRWQQWESAQMKSYGAFTGCRVCSPSENSSWRRACTPEIQVVEPPASLPLQFHGVVLVPAWTMRLSRGVLLIGTHCIHKYLWLQWQLKYFAVKQNSEDLREVYPHYFPYNIVSGVDVNNPRRQSLH